MNAEDRVLVGVINRKKDFLLAQNERWYRIPVAHRFVETEHIAFFLSGRPFKDLSGSIAYHARITGHELARRRDLIPSEVEHPRADSEYYRVAFRDLQARTPPIRNPNKRVITFIYTTGDRFQAAETIDDLYSNDDKFVERIYHRMKAEYPHIERLWEAMHDTDDFAPGIRLMHRGDVVDQQAQPTEQITLQIDRLTDDDRILSAIRAELEAISGPVIVNIPLFRRSV